MISEVVYKGYDNSIWLLLEVNGEAADLSDVTQIQLEVGETTLDSDTLGLGEDEVFDNSEENGDGYLILRLGGTSLAVGTHIATLILFDEDNPNGVVWGKFRLRVKSI